MRKLHTSLDMVWLYRIFHCYILFLLIEELKYTLRCSRHRLKLVCHLCYLLDRLCEILHILYKCLDITDCDDILYGKYTS